MTQFALRYVCIGLIGLAACYLGTPALREFVLKDPRLSAEARRRIGDSMGGLGKWLDGTVSRARLALEHGADDLTATEADTAPHSPVDVVPEPAGPPAVPETHSAVVSSRDRRPERWGVVQEPTTRIYTLKGKFLRRIEAGSCVEFTHTIRSRDGEEYARARIMPNRSGQEILVPLSALGIVEGPFADASELEKTLRVRRARLLSNIIENDRARAKRLNPANPYARRYEAARKEYLAFWQRVDDLKTAAKGPNRAQALDELRQMKAKGDDIRLGDAYEKSKTDYHAWEHDHPHSPTPDSRMAALQNQLADVDRQLARFRERP